MKPPMKGKVTALLDLPPLGALQKCRHQSDKGDHTMLSLPQVL